MVKKRNPYLASLLTCIAPGLGQFYNTQITLAFIIALSWQILSALGLMFFYETFITFVMGPLLLMVIFITILAHAFIYARKSKQSNLTKYNNLWFYALFIIVTYTLSISQTILKTPTYESYYMAANSMRPVLSKYDRFIVKTSDYQMNRGDIMVFKTVNNPDPYAKRLIGLPGDTVQYSNGILIINEKIVPRRAIRTVKRSAPIISKYEYGTLYTETLPNGRTISIYEINDDGYLDNTRKYNIPDNHVFMLGDNRDNSNDSRAEIGLIHKNDIIGKGLYIFYSKEFDKIGQSL